MSKAWQKYTVLFVLSFLVLILFNWMLPVTDPVESNYALTAKEMLLAGDWFSPRIYGEYWYDKPIFTYWTLELSYYLFGFTDFASRLPSAVMGAFTVAGTAWLAKLLLRRERTEWYAAGFLLTAFAFEPMSRAVITDAALLLWTVVTMYGAYRGLTEDRRKWMVLAYAGAGMACLTKGPVGLVLPGLILLVWLAVTPEVRRWRRLFDPVGLLVFFVVAAPWYALMYVRHGEDFLFGFLGLHNYLRATVSEHPSDNVFYYYLVVMPLYALPWTPLTLRALWRGRKERTVAYRFMATWIAVTFLFYTAMATKYLTYCYIAIVPMILLAAQEWTVIGDRGERRQYWWLTAPVLVMVLIWVGATFAAPEGNWTLFYVLAAVSIFVMVQAQQRGTSAGLVARAVLVLVLVFLTAMVEGLVPVMAKKSTRNVVPIMAQLPGHQYSYRTYITSYAFYSGRVPYMLDHKIEVNDIWERKYTMPYANRVYVLNSLQAGKMVTIFVPYKEQEYFLTSHYARYMTLLKKFPEGYLYVTGSREVQDAGSEKAN